MLLLMIIAIMVSFSTRCEVSFYDQINMKHIFYVHSYVTYLVVLGVVEHERISDDDVFLITARGAVNQTRLQVWISMRNILVYSVYHAMVRICFI